MDITKQTQIIRIAKKYYELHMGQMEIAKEEGISKSTVSRLLRKAEELGYIKITLEYPLESVGEIEGQIREMFPSIKEVFITPDVVGDKSIVLKDTCRALASHLDRYIKDREVVGVSWGKTMNCLADCISSLQAKDIKVVQLNGGVSKHTNPTGATKIVDSLSKAGNGVGYMFPVPAVVDSREISDVLKKDSQVKKVLTMAEEARVTIFSVGALSRDSILYEVGYLKEKDFLVLKEDDAVGDIASRFITEEGKIANEELNGRVVGLDLEALKKKEYNVGVAVGLEKVDAILGALRGGYVNVLYTDEKTARELVKKEAYCF